MAIKKQDKRTILVTGATGYVAGWIVKKLLQEGHTVHAPIRDSANKDKTKYLDKIAETCSGSIRYFEANLLEQGSYDASMKGCEIVFHTASPFKAKVKDAQKQLLDPAINGTINVLNSVNKTESVKRVVLTSSIAAMYGDTKDLLEYPNKTMDENHWNRTSSPKQSPYCFSKTISEKEAWKMQKSQDRWDLVVINPAFVMGPGINPDGSSESYNLIKKLGDGTMRFGSADIHIGFVDVRDVAEAHYRAAFSPNVKGRHLLSAENHSFLDLAHMLRPKYGNKYPLPKKNLPKWMMMIAGPWVGMTRQFVKDNVGYKWNGDNTKSIKALGIKFRPIEESVNDFFAQMEENGVYG